MTRPAEAEPYTSHTTGRGTKRPPPPLDRLAHGTGLARATEEAAAGARDRRRATAATLDLAPASDGVRVVFDSAPGFALEHMGFDPQRQGDQPELLNVQRVGDGDDAVERATVFVPEGKLRYFVQRFEDYAQKSTGSGNPRYGNFVERIAAVRLATIEALWTDAPEEFPPPDAVVWWEIWLRRTDDREIERLTVLAERLGVDVGHRHLVFDNRIIVLALASAAQLATAVEILDDFAELRQTRLTAAFFSRTPPTEQASWVDELLERTERPGRRAPSICILDTGVNREHPLIEFALDAPDAHACDPSWGTHDHDGHGTEMAGLALYGDLVAALESPHPVLLGHRLESVKILPPRGDNDRDLYAAITADAVSRVEIEAPNRRRGFSMAVTATTGGVAGLPTSWSAAVDALAAGRAFDSAKGELTYLDGASVSAHRLFIVSAGNIRDLDGQEPHLDRSDVSPAEEPAQAWNALVIGAYTDLVDVASSGPDFDAWSPVAPPGELSPFSRTSVAFSRDWPLKPDVVLEGGNVARSPGGDLDWPESLQLLTTHWQPANRQFTTSNATSAATAQAAHIVGSIAAEYPSLWPEAIRALVVHAAEWTPAMRQRFDLGPRTKAAREALVRRYGFGVPTLERALRSAGDALTMIVQDTIRPFDDGALCEMHVHDLPWPVAALDDLSAAPVRLRVTLSYFVEPNPARRGWRRRYRYASHGLRFDLKKPEETEDEFRKRVNKDALGEAEQRPTAGDADGWFLGAQARGRGSLHADIWEGTAAELASRGRLAVFPVTGWWKEQRKRDGSSLGARYALVLSIQTPVETADLWTPVAQQVGLPISVLT